MPTLDGSATRVKIPEGTESGKQFRLKGKGMPVLRSTVLGDMYIQVEVETPKNLTRKQRELLEEFERESHKAIVIGKQGERLKAVGTDARQDMEKLFEKKVFLEMWVKVRESWREDERVLAELGY